MLEATDITFRVGHKTLIEDFSAVFEPGKLHLIIGPNGAGKSTIIKILSRLLQPQNGTVKYDDADVAQLSEVDLARRRAVLSQAIEVAFPLTVREVVMMGRYPHFGNRPGDADETIVDELMEVFEVTEFGSRNYQTLSGGERQRVNFARVLAQLQRKDSSPTDRDSSARNACRYLFLDEPLTFLDIRHQIEFMKQVREFASAPDIVTVGVVHDLNLAARFSDRLLLLNDGRIRADGNPREVLTTELILEVFGVNPIFIPFEQSGIHLLFD